MHIKISNNSLTSKYEKKKTTTTTKERLQKKKFMKGIKMILKEKKEKTSIWLRMIQKRF